MLQERETRYATDFFEVCTKKISRKKVVFSFNGNIRKGGNGRGKVLI